MQINKKYVALLAAGVIASASLFGAVGVQAAMQPKEKLEIMGRMGMGVVGKVTAVNGNTITLTSNVKERGQVVAPIAYTIDASGATVMKNGAVSTVSGIAVGDTIMVQGTVTGTNVVAKMIRNGLPPKMEVKEVPQGDGQPIVGGTITAISGNMVTITNKSNITYTIDITNAKIEKAGVRAATGADLKAGDEIIAQGLVNGTSVTASTVIDHPKPEANSNPGSTDKPNMGKKMRLFGGFFKRLFGF